MRRPGGKSRTKGFISWPSSTSAASACTSAPVQSSNIPLDPSNVSRVEPGAAPCPVRDETGQSEWTTSRLLRRTPNGILVPARLFHVPEAGDHLPFLLKLI